MEFVSRDLISKKSACRNPFSCLANVPYLHFVKQDTKKIIVTGPECSGKTTLAQALGDRLSAVVIPEISRPMLLLTDNNYEITDLTKMASYQQALELSVEGLDPRFIICDTSALEYKIWLSYRFGEVDELIDQYFSLSQALFVLCAPLPIWVPDSFRSNPYDREQLFELYQSELSKLQVNYLILPPDSVEQRISSFLSWLSNQES